MGSIALWDFRARAQERVEIATARKKTAAEFLVLAGALLAGLGQLVGQSTTLLPATPSVTGGAAVLAMASVMAGAVVLVLDISQQHLVIRGKRISQEFGDPNTQSLLRQAPNLRQLDSLYPGLQKAESDAAKLDVILPRFARWTDRLLRAQIGAWVAGATLYGVVLIDALDAGGWISNLLS